MHFPQLAQATTKFPSDVYCRLMFCSVPFSGWNEREGKGEIELCSRASVLEAHWHKVQTSPRTSFVRIPASYVPTPHLLPNHAPTLTRIKPSSDALLWFWQVPCEVRPPGPQIFLSNYVNFYSEVRNCLIPPWKWEAYSWSPAVTQWHCALYTPILTI
jgi:hypothetical protein